MLHPLSLPHAGSSELSRSLSDKGSFSHQACTFRPQADSERSVNREASHSAYTREAHSAQYTLFYCVLCDFADVNYVVQSSRSCAAAQPDVCEA